MIPRSLPTEMEMMMTDEMKRKLSKEAFERLAGAHADLRADVSCSASSREIMAKMLPTPTTLERALTSLLSSSLLDDILDSRKTNGDDDEDPQA